MGDARGAGWWDSLRDEPRGSHPQTHNPGAPSRCTAAGQAANPDSGPETHGAGTPHGAGPTPPRGQEPTGATGPGDRAVTPWHVHHGTQVTTEQLCCARHLQIGGEEHFNVICSLGSKSHVGLPTT